MEVQEKNDVSVSEAAPSGPPPASVVNAATPPAAPQEAPPS